MKQKNTLKVPKPTVFLDIDYTILDVEALRVAESTIIEANYGQGTSKIFWDVYEEVKADIGVVDVKEVAMRFAARIKSQNYASAVGAFLEIAFEDYLYPGARELINYLSHSSNLVIFTHGHELFQGQKIKILGLDKAAKKVVITPLKKHEAAMELLAEVEGAAFMLDDNGELLVEAKKLKPDLVTIWMRLKSALRGVEAIGADFEAKSIEQVLDFLENNKVFKS